MKSSPTARGRARVLARRARAVGSAFGAAVCAVVLAGLLGGGLLGGVGGCRRASPLGPPPRPAALAPAEGLPGGATPVRGAPLLATSPRSARLRLLSDPPSPSALFLGWRAETADVLVAITRAAPTGLPINILASAEDTDAVRDTFRGVTEAVHVWPVPVVTPWVRDYGPLLARGPLGVVLVDARYGDPGLRPADDAVPGAVAARWRAAYASLPLDAEGGNLVADGRGRCYTTLRLLERNPERSEEEIGALLRDRLGCDRLVVLPRLRREPTGHADVLVSFVGDIALVAASTDPRDGPALDEVAELVASRSEGESPGAAGGLVVRMPLARDRAGSVLSWVQVLSLGDRLLYPIYTRDGASDSLRAAQEKAVATLARTFPGRRLVGVPLAGRAALGGGLRCYTLAIP